MGRARLNPQRVKLHYSYTVEEISRLLGVHKNTVRAWIKSGLIPIDDRRPALILGRSLRGFLQDKRRSGRTTCPPGTMYCLKCRAARRPALGMVEFVRITDNSGNLRGICGECSTLIHRRARKADLAVVMPGLDVTSVQSEQRLIECREPSLHCDSDKRSRAHG